MCLGRRIACLALLAVLSLTSLSAAADAPLRYNWKPGSEHHYRVKISVELDDGEDEYSGLPFYRVASRTRNEMVLDFYGDLTKFEKRGDRVLPTVDLPPALSGRFIERAAGLDLPESRRRLKLNDRGKLILEQGRSELPYLLGDLAHLLIFPLPQKDQKSWTISNDVSITSFTPELRGRGFPVIDRKSLAAEQESTFTVEGTEGKVVTLREETTLTTLEQVKEKPMVEIVTVGTRKFDTEVGGPISYEARVTVTVRQKNTSVEFPITISIQRRSEEELAKAKKDAAEAVAKSKAQMAEYEAERTKPVDAAEATELVKMLKSGNKDQIAKALRRLGAKGPEKPDRRISQAIEPHLLSSDFSTSYAAAGAMKNWATEDCLPTILKVLDGKNVAVKGSVIEILERFPSKQVVEELAAMLTDPSGSFQAAQALKKMGPIAEAPTLAQLRTTAGQQPQHQNTICQVLKEVGGAKSLAALKPIAAKDGFESYFAKQAIAEIERRVERDKRRGR